MAADDHSISRVIVSRLRCRRLVRPESHVACYTGGYGEPCGRASRVAPAPAPCRGRNSPAVCFRLGNGPADFARTARPTRFFFEGATRV